MPIEQKYYHPEIKWYHKINPLWWFRNIDDPMPPDNPKFNRLIAKSWTIKILKFIMPKKAAIWIWWNLKRNTLHNFTGYVIGVAGRDIIKKGDYPNDRFNPTGKGYNKLWVIYKCKHLPITLYLPFISYISPKRRWYIGWNDSGFLSAELKFTKHKGG